MDRKTAARNEAAAARKAAGSRAKPSAKPRQMPRPAANPRGGKPPENAPVRVNPPSVNPPSAAIPAAQRTRDLDRSDGLAPFLIPKERPEIVFGLVGPIGVDLQPVIDAIQHELKGVYTADVIRLSDKIAEFFGVNYSGIAENTRIRRLMKLGTHLRSETKTGDAVALLGIEEINRLRHEKYEDKCSAHAYILRSLKNPIEVQTLRSVYGKGFFAISVYSPREQRVNALAERIKRSVHGGTGKGFRQTAEQLLEIDELEGDEFGQDVQDAFPTADFFVYTQDKDRMRNEIRRFIHLIFGYQFFTPSRDEHGMHHARSAALRSADMNRQVGAAILNSEGDVLALGCNDVPKFGGGLYWPDDRNDSRDFKRQRDSMAEHREQVLGEIVSRLGKRGVLPGVTDDAKVDELVASLSVGENKSVLKGTAIMSILEFGRSVHAEMAALSTAARLGVSVKNATLFCTTFPCHICARHIVASGISKVVYVEPYPKSKAKELHDDSVSVDPERPDRDKVNFVPFEGIAPVAYYDLFQAPTRKDSLGRALPWTMDASSPRFLRFLNTYTDLEKEIVGEAIKRMRSMGINAPTPEELDQEPEKPA